MLFEPEGLYSKYGTVMIIIIIVMMVVVVVVMVAVVLLVNTIDKNKNNRL